MTMTEHESRERACAEMATTLRLNGGAWGLRPGVTLTPEDCGALRDLFIAVADLIERLAPHTVCGACGEPCGTGEAVMEHIRTCERHPLCAEIERLEREKRALIAACVEERGRVVVPDRSEPHTAWYWRVGSKSGHEPARELAEVAVRRALGWEVPQP